MTSGAEQPSGLSKGRDGVPSWDGTPSSFQAFVESAELFEQSTPFHKRYLCGPRLQAELSGAARRHVVGQRADWLSHNQGVNTLLQHLRQCLGNVNCTFELSKLCGGYSHTMVGATAAPVVLGFNGGPSRTSGSTSSRDDSKINCLRCGKLGHRIANCPHGADYKKPPDAMAPFVCYASAGVVTEDQTEQTHQALAAEVPTTQEAIMQGKCVLDSGATRSLGSARAIEQVMRLSADAVSHVDDFYTNSTHVRQEVPSLMSYVQNADVPTASSE
ncbi:unnamed protein product [Symbiodinium microadriaticum]|nr:unnamed protein product [Symbiodinium microadriaticum]